jgi:FAD/FMN-containing dehydrogenase
MAIDALNNAPAKRVGLDGAALVIQAGGSPAVLDRYRLELPEARVIADEAALWTAIREFTPAFVAEHPSAQVARVSCTLSEVPDVLASTSGPVVARAGSGVCYLYFERAVAPIRPWRYVMEYGEPAFDADFAMMKKLKDLFDPRHLLNPGRLYGRI